MKAKSPDAPEALNQLCQIYWPPIYAFIRGQGFSPADAADAVQGFFGHVLEHRVLSEVVPEKGKPLFGMELVRRIEPGRLRQLPMKKGRITPSRVGCCLTPTDFATEERRRKPALAQPRPPDSVPEGRPNQPVVFSRPFGTGVAWALIPALKRRAVFECPSGTRTAA